MSKSVNIDIPEGYEIDKIKSTFEKIVFKEKVDTGEWLTRKQGKEIAGKGLMEMKGA